MLSLLRSTWLIARMQLPRVALSKRSALCLVVALGPAALALFVQQAPRNPPPSVEILLYPGYFLVLQVVVPVLALIAGAGVVTEEIDDRTITYLFTRPIPRAALYFGRWLAAALVLALTLALSVALLALAARYGGNPPEKAEIPSGAVLPLLRAVVFGGVVYSALFATLGTFLKHPMIVGLAYAFTIEAFLANLPGKSQSLTIQFYLRSALRGNEVWQQVEPLHEGVFDPPGAALRTLAWILVAALAIGALTIRRKQYVLTA